MCIVGRCSRYSFFTVAIQSGWQETIIVTFLLIVLYDSLCNGVYLFRLLQLFSPLPFGSEFRKQLWLPRYLFVLSWCLFVLLCLTGVWQCSVVHSNTGHYEHSTYSQGCLRDWVVTQATPRLTCLLCKHINLFSVYSAVY